MRQQQQMQQQNYQQQMQQQQQQAMRQQQMQQQQAQQAMQQRQQQKQQSNFSLGSDGWDANAPTPRGNRRNSNGTPLRGAARSASPRPNGRPMTAPPPQSGPAAGGYKRLNTEHSGINEHASTAVRAHPGGASSIALGRRRIQASEHGAQWHQRARVHCRACA